MSIRTKEVRSCLGLMVCLALLSLVLTACGGLKEPSTSVGGVVVGVSTQALSSDDVTKVVVTISGPDISPNIVHSLVKVNNQWQGTIGQIPAGKDRTVRAESFNKKDDKLYESEVKGVTIQKGKTSTVVLLLQQVKPPTPFKNAAPVLQGLTATSNQLGFRETLNLEVKATDPDGDKLSYSWQATGGSFSKANSSSPIWTSPGKGAGSYTISVQVSDGRGGTTGTSFAVEVQPYFSTGAAAINLDFNTFPEVHNVTSTKGLLQPDETATLQVSATDNDRDTLSYQWSDGGGDCKGTFRNQKDNNVEWKAPKAAPASGFCTLTVTVTDGKGGKNEGSLQLKVGPSLQPSFAPKVLTTYQSATQAQVGTSLVFRVQGQDPQGGKLSVKWSDGKTTLTKGVQSTTTQPKTGGPLVTSQLTWTLPASPCQHKLIVSLSNGAGLTTITTFQVTCIPPPQPDPAKRWGRSVAVGRSGDRFITGEFEGVVSFGSTTLTSTGKTDIFVAKHDSNGNWLWAATGTGKERSTSRQIAVDANGNTYIVGWYLDSLTFRGTGTQLFKLPVTTQDKAFVAKFDGSGICLWAKTIGGTDPSLGWGIALDNGGQPVITGSFQGAGTFGSLTLSPVSGKNLFVAKLDPAGNWLWANLAESKDIRGQSVAVDPSNNVYLTGYYEDVASFVISPTQIIKMPPALETDVFVAKLSPAGVWVWAKRVEGSNRRNAGNAIAVDSNGSPHVTGVFAGTATFGSTTLTSTSGLNVFVTRLDTNGNWLWSKAAGGAQSRQGKSLTLDSNGYVYLTGVFQDTAVFGTTTLSSTGPTDMYVAKLNDQGDWLCAEAFTGTDLVSAEDIAIDNQGVVALTGFFRGATSFQNTSYTSTLEDLFLWDYTFASSCVTSTSNATGTTGPAYSIATDVHVGPNNNIYITGLFGGGNLVFGNTTLSAQYGTSFVAKMDPQGNWLWAKKMAYANNSNLPPQLAVDNQGNSYVMANLGSATQLGSFSLSTGAGINIFLAKLDTQGNWKWAKRANSTGGIIFIRSLVVDANRRLTALIGFTLNLSVDAQTYASTGQDGVAIQWTESGQYRWAHQFNAPNGGGIYADIATDNSGNIHLTGNQSIGKDVYSRLDSNGQLLLSKLSTGGSPLGYKVAVNSNGTAYILGSSNGMLVFGSTTLSSSTSQPPFVAALSASGNWLWAKRIPLTFSGPTHLGVGSLSTNANGDVVISGHFTGTQSFGSTQLTSAGGTDVVVARIDEQGNWRSAERGGGTGNDYGMGGVVGSNGAEYTVGAFAGTATFDVHPLTTNSTYSLYVWRRK
ncbi:MAG: hypothetical protein EP343_32865 [Deltaproteobacteria bacterium]|nr:MAG: hypothetical protein EP343_32865 [Deltaproteobacteria bacterium]